MTKQRTLTFEQITDSRWLTTEKCLPELQDRIEKLKVLLDIKNIDLKIEEPYLIEWEGHIQYRATFYIRKDTKTITWNDIYILVNSVKAVPYKFI